MSRKPLREIDFTDVPVELALLVASPFYSPLTLFNAYHDLYWYHFQWDTEDRPERRWDVDRTRLHTASWTAGAGASWLYHALKHPGKYPGIRFSGDIVKLVGHQVMHGAPVIAPVAIAAASTAGWIATAEEHGAVVPGVASGIGMPLTPEIYSSTASDPTGYRRGLREWWSSLW